MPEKKGKKRKYETESKLTEKKNIFYEQKTLF